jgi:hypothetical protein
MGILKAIKGIFSNINEEIEYQKYLKEDEAVEESGLSEFAESKMKIFTDTGKAAQITADEIREHQIHEPESMWGHRISPNLAKRKLDGHMSNPYVKNGDLLRLPTKTEGRYALYEIYNVKYSSDPTDLFFADFQDIGFITYDDVEGEVL